MRRIGLTGGIGSGKSTVARALAALEVVVIDTDAIAHALTKADGPAIPAIRARFGASVIDANGNLDRARMRAIAFSDPHARSQLESILHPMIGAECERQAALASGTVAFDVPLLVESGHWRSKVDKILVVDCTFETQIKRVVERSGWTEADVRAVIEKQASRTARRSAADAVIFNQQLSIESLAMQVGNLLRVWMHLDTR